VGKIYQFDGPLMVEKTGVPGSNIKGHFGDGTGAVNVRIDGAAGSNRDLSLASNDSARWIIRCNNTAESGSDVGSDLQILRRDDAGAAVDAPLKIVRSTGQVQLLSGLVGTPSLAFQPDSDSGIYRVGADNWALVAGGTEACRIDKGGTYSQLLTVGGSASEPAIAANADKDTGIHLADQVVDLVRAGTAKFRVSTYVQILTEAQIDDNVRLQEIGSTPSIPNVLGTECNVYMKANNFVIAYNDGGTVRYKYLLLSGTGSTWTHSTSAP
jgi:hypothetical protein